MLYNFSVASDAYRAILNDLLMEESAPDVRGLNMAAEFLNTTVVIQRAETLDMIIPTRKLNKAYNYCEALWNCCNTANLWMLEAFNKKIERFVADQDERDRATVAWGYGPTISKELPKLVRELELDIYTRRAVLGLPRIQNRKGTPPCLVSLQFIYRNNLLHCIVTMRSNDAWLGFPLDILQFGIMQQIVAARLNVAIGSYYHNVGSLHLYEQDIPAARRMLESVPKHDTFQIRKLTHDALKWIESGSLLLELTSVCKGGSAFYHSPFFEYTDFMARNFPHE